MQRISRATDTVWTTAAFDPRKPVDPDWASQPLSPILRSGVEPHVLNDSPAPHDHFSDSMGWSASPPTAADYANPDSEHYDPYTDPGYREDGDAFSSHEVPDHDLQAIRNHRDSLRGTGRIEGNDPGMMVQYYNDSNVNHYYNHNPLRDSDKPWELTTTHWQLREPMISRHPDFESAAAGADRDGQILTERGIA